LIKRASRKVRRGLAFFKEVRENFTELGQVAPSSKDLAKKLTAPIAKIPGKRKILEVGPGTGGVTKQIVTLLKPGDELIVCEINPRLLKLVETKIAKLELNKKIKITFICSPVQDLKGQFKRGYFDAIISSLPFTNFPPELVRDILDLYRSMIRKGGVLTFYEYLALRKVGQIFRKSAERSRVTRVEKVLDAWERDLKKKRRLTRTVSFLNLPPAKVFVAKLS
jgi:phosphatidylethanolamine/phosphatidyl-N-methylethanolamine N-methyltransferase